VLDLATAAAEDALEQAGLTGADIDAVILSTVTYFAQTPAAAAIVADRIGATPAAAYDISAACAGYSYGIGQADALVRSGAARHVLVIGAEKMSDFIDPTDRSISFLRQDGPSVFKWAAFQMAPVALRAIEAAGLTPADVDVFVPHQANMRIIDQMIKQLGLREDVVVGRDIEDTGNTSAASIPLATERLIREGAAKTGHVLLQIGFGAGLVYAAQVVIVP